MKNQIHTTISYKTKEQTVNVTIDFTHIRINCAPLTVEVKTLVQSRNNQLPASKRWKLDNTAWYKEIKSIPYGLSNMFHKHKNYLVEPIEEFVKDVLKLQDYTLEGAGSFTQEDFHNYQKNYRAAEKTRDSILYPKFNPSYTANVWYDISLKAYNKRKEFYENNNKMDTPISTPIRRKASPDPIVKKENKVDIKEDIKVQETNKEKIQANGFGFFGGLLEILAPAAIVVVVVYKTVEFAVGIVGEILPEKPEELPILANPENLPVSKEPPIKMSIMDVDDLTVWFSPETHITYFCMVIFALFLFYSFIAVLVYFKIRTDKKEIPSDKVVEENQIVKNAIDPVTVVCVVAALLFVWWNNR